MTKLIIQIPCWNEADTLPTTLGDLPRDLPGVDRIEWLVVDDGSSDDTARIARDHGADHVVVLPTHQGLARAFSAGLDASLSAGADVVVNTDADNQYRAADIGRLIAPVLSGEAEIVVGERPIGAIGSFSRSKKRLQRLGSFVVRLLSQTDIPDAPSGFRAFSRSAAMRMNVFNEYSYTLETIIQAGLKGMAITSVPVGVNDQTRPSRLVRSQFGYLRRQALTMVRIFMTYRPFHFFAAPGAASLLIGLLFGVRFLYFYLTGEGSGHVQSVILAALLIGIGFLLIVVGFLADLAAVNRKLLEKVHGELLSLRDLQRRESPE